MNNLEKKISDFEKNFGLIFPAELKDFYLYSELEKYSLLFFERLVDPDFLQGNVLERIYPLEKLIEIFELLHEEVYYAKTLKNVDLLPFGEGTGGVVICMASSPDPTLHGKIYVWDGDFDATFQADSLEEFLGQLRVFEEIE